jgi:hypothetical protein
VLHYTPPLMERPETAQAHASGSGSESGGNSTGHGSGDRGSPRDLAAGSGSLKIEASVVLPAAGKSELYGMFEALSVTPDGAILRGGLLLEVNEEITIELRLPDLSAFRARARVVEILRDERPAMKVIWTGVGEADRHRLSR